MYVSCPLDSRKVTYHVAPCVQELLARKLPYHNLRSDAQVIAAVIQNVLPKCPDPDENHGFFEKEIWSLCSSCWRMPPDARPSMDALLSDLDTLLSKARALRNCI